MRAEFGHPSIGSILWSIACAFFGGLCLANLNSADAGQWRSVIAGAGLLACAAVFAVSAYLKRGIWLCVQDGHVEGQTKWHRRMSLLAEQIAYAMEFTDGVLVLLDMEGKRYVFTGMINSEEMRERILIMCAPDEPMKETEEEIKEKRKELKRWNKREIFVFIVWIFCILACLIALGIGTGDRDFPEMTEADWHMVDVCAGTMVVLALGTYFLICHAGKCIAQSLREQWRLRGMTALYTPMPTPNVFAAYVNPTYTRRFVFCKSEKSVSMYIENISDDGGLGKNTYFETFASMGDCLSSLEDCMDRLEFENFEAFEKLMIKIQ